MRGNTLFVSALLSLLVGLGAGACQRSEDKSRGAAAAPGAGSGSAIETVAVAPRAQAVQIEPPVDLANPPADAVKTSSGLIYKKLVAVDDGEAIGRNDTVMLKYTGWRQATGETFFTNRDNDRPMALPLANAAPGFTEAMQLLKQGEKAVLWIPPSLGHKGAPPAGTTPETLVYEVEVVDILPAPKVPEDLGQPPAHAKSLPSGVKYVLVNKGYGKLRARNFDTVTFHYSAWDDTGRMFDSSEIRKRPYVSPPYRQTPVMEEILTFFPPGARARVWIPSEKLQQGGRRVAGMPDGMLTYEVELVTISKNHTPWPVPPDVSGPPANAQKTPKGVAYKVLRASKQGGAKPTPADRVRVHYTGWTTDGRMFDSSVVRDEPAEFSLQGVIAGWTDGIPVMSVGDRVRFWIPEELAYKGAPGKPQGMLVFDVELLEIKPAPAPVADLPAPPDVAGPPADAQKSPRGVSYKILKSVSGAPHPKPTDTVKVHYTGWTTDGKMFDSSKTRGQPLEFSLQRVIPGWTDAIPMVGVGETARLWIPEELAYKGGGGPQGMLVFDVELLEIKSQ